MSESKARVLGLVGSPRRGLNTATLVERVLAGAAGAGAATELVYLHERNLEPCEACNACKDTGRCVREDGMRELYPALDSSRGLVIGTPIYFDHVSAQTKLFLDRLYPYVGPDMEHLYPRGVKAVLVGTWGDEGATTYDGVMSWLRKRLAFYFDIETLAVLTAAATSNAPVWDRPDLLERAVAAGRSLAGSLS
ncbi:MAG: flavodoxin family protein [Gemmatimonadota bacterium]